MSEALIQPEVLSWAVDRSNFSLTEIAKSLQINKQRLDEWKNGESKPTFRQAQKLASTLHIPFGYLFLSTIPDERIPIPDLRTIKNVKTDNFSANFIDTINNVILKHEWYKEYLLNEGFEPLDFVGKYTTRDDPEVIALDIAKVIGINNKLRESVDTWEEFLTRIINLSEKVGIIVLKSGIVGSNTHRRLSVDEFRGFAICDKIAPMIFINTRDFKVSQIFTIAHELSHIWIGQSGISNVTINDIKRNNNAQTESVCNLIAAELLVPRKLFAGLWNNVLSVRENIKILSRKFRVSNIVIIRRAYDLGNISENEYVLLYTQEMDFLNKRQLSKNEEESGGGDFYKTLYSRNSKLLTATIISATLEGNLAYREASNLLCVNSSKIKEIASRLGIS